MKDNRIAYKQTPLGGCSMNGTCDKLSLAHISACVTCPKAIFNDRSVKALSTLKPLYQKSFSDLMKALRIANKPILKLKQLINYWRK